MNALLLRILACLCMLLDHIGYAWGIGALRAVGRLAFPLFVFLIYNGYTHTSSRSRYALRLGLFALLSQLPFCLFLGYESYWYKGNVFVTLLLALLCLWAVDAMRQRKVLRALCWLPPAVLFVCYFFGWVSSDYSARGILLILVFYFVERTTLRGKVLTVFGMFLATYYSYFTGLGVNLLKGILGSGWSWPTVDHWTLMQLWGLLSAFVIFSFNGQKGSSGKHPKLVQYGFYLFYPVHQLILWALRVWL